MGQQVLASRIPRKQSLWLRALRKLYRDKVGVGAFIIVCAYFFVACLVWMGVTGSDWAELQGMGNDPVSTRYWFGTNINGQDIFARAVYSTRTAFEIGIVVAVASTILGALLGAFAGFFSSTWIDELVLWLYACIDCIPFYLFVAAVAFALRDNPFAMHIAMIGTFWTGTGRLIRGEFIRLKNLEFVESARAIGVSRFKIIFRHMLPNTMHILLVQASLMFVAAIKSEVILSFLGLGVKNGVSWGLMIAESTSEVAYGTFNNFAAASGFLFVLVFAFNLFSDALQDALDPKKVS